MQNTSGKWATVPGSGFNFRLTALSENIQLNGPARDVKSVTSLNCYGRSQGAASRHGWESVVCAEDKYVRWNINQLGISTDGSDDYRNELNTFGYTVEIDAYDKTKTARKRTALGRFAHESAAFGKPVVGQPLAVYMGDDSRGEYIYKFVSNPCQFFDEQSHCQPPQQRFQACHHYKMYSCLRFMHKGYSHISHTNCRYSPTGIALYPIQRQVINPSQKCRMLMLLFGCPTAMPLCERSGQPLAIGAENGQRSRQTGAAPAARFGRQLRRRV